MPDTEIGLNSPISSGGGEELKLINPLIASPYAPASAGILQWFAPCAVCGQTTAINTVQRATAVADWLSVRVIFWSSLDCCVWRLQFDSTKFVWGRSACRLATLVATASESEPLPKLLAYDFGYYHVRFFG